MANSVTARFNDDCKVHVAMSDDTTVTKAVIIDAEGNETDIGGGGGGSSDFSTAEVTFTKGELNNDASEITDLIILSDDKLSMDVNAVDGISILEPFTKTFVLYKGKQTISINSGTFNSVTGDAIYDENEETLTITGDCNITINYYEIA